MRFGGPVPLSADTLGVDTVAFPLVAVLHLMSSLGLAYWFEISDFLAIMHVLAFAVGIFCILNHTGLREDA